MDVNKPESHRATAGVAHDVRCVAERPADISLSISRPLPVPPFGRCTRASALVQKQPLERSRETDTAGQSTEAKHYPVGKAGEAHSEGQHCLASAPEGRRKIQCQAVHPACLHSEDKTLRSEDRGVGEAVFSPLLLLMKCQIDFD